MQSSSLVSIHLSDNEVADHTELTLKQIFKISHSHHHHKLNLNSDDFRKVKATLLAKDFSLIFGRDEEVT